MKRSLYAQMSYAIHQQMRIGTSRWSDALNGVDTNKYFYSIRTFRNTKGMVRTFANYMKETHPEVCLVRDITPEHVEGFIQDRSWLLPSSVGTYATFFRKLDGVLNATYHCKLNFGNIDYRHLLAPNEEAGSNAQVARNPSMEMEDLIKLHDYMADSKSSACFVPFMIYTIGAGLEEITCLRPEEIDVEKRVVHLNNCKGGGKRTVPIGDLDLPSWKIIKQYCLENGWPTVVGGISRASVSDAIRKAKHAIGIQEKYPHQGCQAIRKLFAIRRLEEELNKGKDLESAWMIVQRELGNHSLKSRNKFFKTYIGMTMREYKETYLSD